MKEFIPCLAPDCIACGAECSKAKGHAGAHVCSQECEDLVTSSLRQARGVSRDYAKTVEVLDDGSVRTPHGTYKLV